MTQLQQAQNLIIDIKTTLPSKYIKEIGNYSANLNSSNFRRAILNTMFLVIGLKESAFYYDPKLYNKLVSFQIELQSLLLTA